ncbi:Fasciclin-like arabinogalactan protein 11 [Hibiscus syriacus]|uniref:Fasciclin-like arabinogalactan protein 11 n=1 Tax=Hibiscus syriacus TaxID=106335 RepID=A0A6A2YW73_HIBSY|nr:fasciclin-like arabinogalactan protein 12 [Hibiscus syriacus]KAE8683653.1 Fasciclin-like arabinogalactan protein 11 [Hibiscus syriacus]
MKQQNACTTLSFLILFVLHCSTTLAQGPAAAPAAPEAPVAPTPAPPGPTNVTKILEKASQFTLFIRLLKTTQVANQLLGQLNNSNNGMTIFAPTDNAFSSLKSGTLNSLNDEQKVELVQFHIIPTYLSSSQFQTISNPLRTQAGDSGDGKFPLNITTSGISVNITSGLTNTSVSGTIYTDGQLAVYQIDQVLQPMQIFAPRPPAPAPAPAKSKKKKSAVVADSPDDETPADNNSKAAATMQNVALFGVAAVVAAFYL